MEASSELLERAEPWARLEASLAAARRGQGRIVSLEGEAGIGKTALTLAFIDAHRGDARVHVGGCEHLTTPEPLGPLRDIARESQGRFALAGGGQIATYEALLRLLTSGRGPALLVLEDIHWADDATLDLLRYLGRRIRTAPVMLLVTFRSDEPDSHGRLVSLWGDMPRDARERIDLTPLSAEAVGSLARAQGRAGRDVYELTGGNPFQVTEVLASEGGGVPRSVQEVTVARAARLSAHARRTLECASIFPRQIDEETLRRIADDPEMAGVEECLASGMLVARDGALAFRHELARRAINEALSPLHRRELHTDALALLKGRNDRRAAEIAHHAEQAGAIGELIQYAIRAAQEAAALGAYREATAHLGKAADPARGLPDAERAQLLERKAFAAHFCGDFAASIRALDDVIAIHRHAGNPLGEGNALRMSAHVVWNLGDSARADELVAQAIDVLEPHAESAQYALALASQSQFDMLADRNETAIPRAKQALSRAERLGRSDIYMQALSYLVTARASTDLDQGAPAIRATIEEARRRGEVDALPRLYANLTSITSAGRRHEGLLDACAEGVAVCASRDQAPLEALIRGNRATALVDMGRLQDAIAEAEDVVYGPYPKSAASLPAITALARARVRTGLPEGEELADARRLPTSSRDLLRTVPLALLDAEAQWLDGVQPRAADRLADLLAQTTQKWSQLWNIGELSLWLGVLGQPPELSPEAAEQLLPPHRAHIAGRWQEAAELWAAHGCPYEQAIALSEADEPSQREALAIFEQLGAAPAARNLRRRMRAAGVRSIPSGPRAARRSHPAGLTRRQADVLDQLASGLSNIEIADRLGLSAKTVEHHVSAILAALEVPTRLAAVQAARERGFHSDADA